MPTDPIDQVLDAAEQSGLLSSDRRERLTRELSADKPSTLSEAAAKLVEKQVLTSYQAERIVAGEGAECVLAGRYQILEKLGEGGMGTVFKAHDAKLDRTVAIKVMAQRHIHHPDAVTRFHREAKALAKVSHPAIVQAYDADEDAGRHFLVMEFVDGESLAHILAHGPVPPTIAADYLYQAVLGLQHAHEKGLVHRDLKPGNLLVTGKRQLKILDLGLARFVQDQIGDPQVTREGTGLGTPDYMAPEQFHDARHVDPRGDIYSLGCTLYHLLTGRVPFPGTSLSEKAVAHEQQEPPRLEELCPEAPAGLVFVVKRMMAKQPAERFQTAQEVAEALAPYVAGSSASLSGLNATKTWQGSQLSFTLAKVARPRSARRRLVAAAAGIALMAIALVVAWPYLFAEEEEAGPGSPDVVPPVAKEDKKDEKPPKPQLVTIPNGLTVAKDGTGQYRSINEALEKIKPGQTIRVLDQALYPEELVLNRIEQFSGITIEAVQGATIRGPVSGKNLIEIQNVVGLRLRGFQLRAEGKITSFVVVKGQCPGLVLEDLDILSPMRHEKMGVELSTDLPAKDAAPMLVKNCTLRNLETAVVMVGSGQDASYSKAFPCGQTRIEGNRIVDCKDGIVLLGAVSQVQVAGNQVVRAGRLGIGLENLLPGAGDICIANNTILETTEAVRLWDSAAKDAKITVANNLLLGHVDRDMFFWDNGGDEHNAKGPGDGKLILKAWAMHHNWRELKAANTDLPGWIPPGPEDKVLKQIDVLSRTPSDKNFLQPKKDSPLAAAGKGGDLPDYVGAVPPAGVEPWNWQWTWDAQVHKLLTVSKDAKEGGRFRTIGAALDKVQPGMTIRVLDNARYEEALLIRNRDQQAGITLEAPKNATLTFAPPASPGLVIQGVPRVTVRGFRFRLDHQNAICVAVGGSPGVSLEELDLKTTQAGTTGINLVLLDLRPDDDPVVIKSCRLEGFDNGVQVLGKVLKTGEASPCRRILVRDNQIANVQHGIAVAGVLSDLAIVGNRMWNCSESAVKVVDLHKDSDGILIANNSIMNSHHCLAVHDPVGAGKGIAIRNNLILTERGPDLAYLGDDPEVFAGWQIRDNWRQVKKPEPSDPDLKKWILAPDDKIMPEIKLLSLDPSKADFLRPGADSPLAKAGAASQGLPPFVGALPPPGTNPWDWDKTWHGWFGKQRKKPGAKGEKGS